ncbi:hypothetical protein RIF29_14881 [Crotalaria pallida]|uniref:Uncharacterized protein n=1 Tax=Crotalaria pallida TaxID=3830 RepID=A0AAN9IAQ0_CROPI
MSITNHQTKVLVILKWILVLVYVTTPIKFVQTRKLDEVKCTPCEGGTTPPPPQIVYPSPPPPIVYPSPPPPPPLIYPSPPPPSPKKPPSSYCPPPPSSYIFITGPPGPDLYTVDQNFNGASPSHYGKFSSFLPLLVGFLSFFYFCVGATLLYFVQEELYRANNTQITSHSRSRDSWTISITPPEHKPESLVNDSTSFGRSTFCSEFCPWRKEQAEPLQEEASLKKFSFGLGGSGGLRFSFEEKGEEHMGHTQRGAKGDGDGGAS